MPNITYGFWPAPIRDVVIDLKTGLLTAAWQKWFTELAEEWSFRWDDLRFPAQGINPPGAASDPTRSTTNGLLYFSGTADNVIAGVAQMPHAWAAGTTVVPHLHLIFPTSASANTRWKLEYNTGSVNGNFMHALGTYTTLATVTVANPANVLKHVIASFGDLTMTGHKESAIIVWKISRLANTDALDTDTNACVLTEFDLHYQVGKSGTIGEYPT